MSMRVDRSTVKAVKDKFASLKRKRENPDEKLDIVERLKLKEQEAEKRKQARREKRKKRKLEKPKKKPQALWMMRWQKRVSLLVHLGVNESSIKFFESVYITAEQRTLLNTAATCLGERKQRHIRCCDMINLNVHFSYFSG